MPGHVIFSREGGVVAGVPEDSPDRGEMPRNRAMKFRGVAVVMRITPGNDARSARAATARSEIGVREKDAFLGEGVDVWRAGVNAAIASEIVVTDVVGHEDHEVRALVSVSDRDASKEAEKECFHGVFVSEECHFGKQRDEATRTWFSARSRSQLRDH